MAGFVLHWREMVLKGLATAQEPGWEAIPEYQKAMISFWRGGERWTRFLLFQLGYPVQKDVGYDPEYDHDRSRGGAVGGAGAGGNPD